MKPLRKQLRHLVPMWVFVGGAALAADNPPQMFVPDGQLVNHVFRVFVTDEITTEMQPRLTLESAQMLTQAKPKEAQVWQGQAIPHQSSQQQVNGQTVQLEGTLLLFDLKGYPIALFKPAVRVVPTLTWKDTIRRGGEQRTLVGQSPVYLAHLGHAIALTAVLLIPVLVMIALWAKRKSPQKKAIMLICGPDGYLSLWRTQLASWTIVVGAMVFCFGMIRLAVPAIPESLVALMGMSLLTGGLSGAKSSSDAAARIQQKLPPMQVNPGKPAWADLIVDYDSSRDLILLSLPKAQMAFWTVLMLVLFVGKTLVEGQLWEIPWQLVALTGFSQAGYIGDKYSKSTP